MKIGMVVQRYGADVVGGAESLCRGVAEALARRGHEIEVMTSCAKSYRTWANHYPEGSERLAGVTVRRFRASRERDVEAFNTLSEQLFTKPDRQGSDEVDWVDAQGPLVRGLVDHLHAAGRDFDHLVFFTYLYYPTVHGVHAAPDRSVLVPTAHDEAPFWLETYRPIFELPRGLIYNTQAEADLVARRFPSLATPSTVAGVGIEALDELVSAADGAPHLDPPVVLYAGRIEEGKGVPQLIEWLRRARAESGLEVRLWLMGELAMELPQDAWIEALGYVSEEEKRDRLAAATVLAAPSALESFGIVLMEANAAGTPVLANAGSQAYVELCRAGNGGLFYEGYREFAETLGLLLGDASLRDAMAASGRAYARATYSWDAVADRYEGFLRSL
ncbi:MAG: glycosyltransferase [Acidobacteria bacterium]|nr:glycosyltransferase [Acidobacteriota bacterium]